MEHSNWKGESAFENMMINSMVGNSDGGPAFVKNFNEHGVLCETGRGVKGLIMDGDRVLVLENPNGKPDLAGGRVEPGETLVEALPREIDEETGCQTEILQPVAEWSFWKNPHLLITGLTFLCRYLGGKIHISDEHSGYKWIRVGELFSLDWERPYFG